MWSIGNSRVCCFNLQREFAWHSLKEGNSWNLSLLPQKKHETVRVIAYFIPKLIGVKFYFYLFRVWSQWPIAQWLTQLADSPVSLSDSNCHSCFWNFRADADKSYHLRRCVERATSLADAMRHNQEVGSTEAMMQWCINIDEAYCSEESSAHTITCAMSEFDLIILSD